MSMQSHPPTKPLEPSLLIFLSLRLTQPLSSLFLLLLLLLLFCLVFKQIVQFISEAEKALWDKQPIMLLPCLVVSRVETRHSSPSIVGLCQSVALFALLLTPFRILSIDGSSGKPKLKDEWEKELGEEGERMKDSLILLLFSFLPFYLTLLPPYCAGQRRLGKNGRMANKNKETNNNKTEGGNKERSRRKRKEK